jgi:glycosyltransferase involved in cell wall biosynthesis
MQFIVAEPEWSALGGSALPWKLNSGTSVDKLKWHFFDTLKQIGDVVPVDPNQQNVLRELFQRKDTIFASFHETPCDSLPCRLLQHSKGALMLPGAYLNTWTFRPSTVNLVTSQKQADQIARGLGQAAPKCLVFSPSLDTDLFRLPKDEERKVSRKQFGVPEDVWHVVYAGRFIAYKGIVQAIRALGSMPRVRKIRFSLVGDHDLDFTTYSQNSAHGTFPLFLEREIQRSQQSIEITFLPACQAEALRSLYWSADLLVYPSFHEDENFGLVPREALLCGTPTIVSDLCGLGQLAEAGVAVLKTYPSLGGIRFSLQEFAVKAGALLMMPEAQRINMAQRQADFVRNECDTEQSTKLLKQAALQLLQQTPAEPAHTGWRSKERFDEWLQRAPLVFQQAVIAAGSPTPDGLYADGAGDIGLGWYAEADFLRAIQSLYTTVPNEPPIQLGQTYAGFWRIALFPAENALVEFGFPGPRMVRFSPQEWALLIASTHFDPFQEPVFVPTEPKAYDIVQRLVHLGYLVPEKIDIQI